MMDIQTITRKEFSKKGKAWAYNDLLRRNNLNLEKHGSFYFGQEHIEKIKEVESIIDKIFKYKKKYLNRREMNDIPFTAIKISDYQYKKKVRAKDIRKKYMEPLEAMGVSIVDSPGTNSLIFRIW